MSIDLSKYKKRILDDEDKLLFEEVIKCASVGASRAAYITIWIACAESFKRRFKEASKRDSNAGKVVGKMNSLEKEKKSIDTYVLEEARKYGFISDTAFAKLESIFELRCIYAHPYEEAPTKEELLNAVSIVLGKVLSLPLKLKEGFIDVQLKEIFSNRFFLDDLEERVTEYANETLMRISEDSYSYMLERIWKNLDKIISDPNMQIFINRGFWVLRSLLEVSFDKYSKGDWHDFTTRYRKAAPLILSDPNIYEKIGIKAQDSVLGNLLDASLTRPSELRRLEVLLESGKLSKRQKKRFVDFIEKFDQEDQNKKSANKLLASGLKITTCFDSIIAHLKTRDWYAQNPVVSIVLEHGPKEIMDLDKDKQVLLGRNILQAADGSARNAKYQLDSMIEDDALWPDQFVFGMLIECFVNEKKQFRFKVRKLDKVCQIVNKMPKARRKIMLDNLIESIESNKAKTKFDISIEEIEECCEILQAYTWGSSICKILKTLDVN